MKILSNIFNISFSRNGLLQSLKTAIGCDDLEKATKVILKLAKDTKDPDAMRWVSLQLEIAQKQKPSFTHDLYKKIDASSFTNDDLRQNVSAYYEEYLSNKLSGKRSRVTVGLLKNEIRNTIANTPMRAQALDAMERLLPFVYRTSTDTVLSRFLDALVQYSAPDSLQRQRFVEKKDALIAEIRKMDPELAKFLMEPQPQQTEIPVFRPYTPEERQAMLSLGAPSKSEIETGYQPS